MQRHAINWEDNPLFRNLSQQELAIVRKWVIGKSFAQGEYLLREGESGSHLYVIMQGSVEILKYDLTHQGEYRLNLLHEGAIVGEMVFFGNKSRTASVKALEPVDTIELALADLKEHHPEIAIKILDNFGAHFAARLEETNREMVVAQKKRYLHEKKLTEMGRLTLRIFVILLIYQTVISSVLFFAHFQTNSVFMFVEMPVILLFSYYCYRVIKKSGYPLSSYGLTLHHWKISLFECFLASTAVALLIVAIKWVVVHTVPSYAGEPIFGLAIKTFGVAMKKSFFGWRQEPVVSLTLAKVAVVCYIISTPLQEFVIRGVVQTSLQRCLGGQNRTVLAILISNLFFAILHQPLHWLMPFVAFLPGLMWGWLFARHRTLLGVSLSHLLLGFWGFYIVGFKY